MSTNANTSSNKVVDVGSVRRRLLDGLMASDATAWEHSLYRTRLYAGYEDPLECWVQRSNAAMRERAGKWGTPPSQMHGLIDENGRRGRAPFNSQVSKAHASITADGLWERRRRRSGTAQDGPHTPWETRLCAVFSAERVPARSTLAYAAIQSLSLHVSPLGAARELALCRTWFRVGRDNTLVGTRKQWVEWLGCKSERWAVQWLRDFAVADVGVELEVVPPSGREKANLYVVRLSLPPIERMVCPSGARRRQDEEEAEYGRFSSWANARDQEHDAAQVRTEPAEPIAVCYVDGPDGKMMAWTSRVEKEDLPEELFGPVEEPGLSVAGPRSTATDALSEEPSTGEDATGQQSVAEEPPEAGGGRDATSTGGGVAPESRAGDSASASLSLAAELARLWERVWYKDLIQSAMDLAELQLKAGRKLSVSRRLNNFVRPVIALQSRYGNPPLLKYALEQTIEGPPLRQPDTHGWVKYLDKVCQNNCARFTGAGPAPGTNAALKAALSPDRLRGHLRAVLREAYDHNKHDETAPARALLWRMLAAVPILAPALYEDDGDLARASVVESFKRGSGYELTEELGGPAAFLNYLPESAWPHAALLDNEARSIGAAGASTGRASDADSQPLATPVSAPTAAALDQFPSQPMFDFEGPPAASERRTCPRLPRGGR